MTKQYPQEGIITKCVQRTSEGAPKTILSGILTASGFKPLDVINIEWKNGEIKITKYKKQE